MTCEPGGHPDGFTVGNAASSHLSSFSDGTVDETISSESFGVIVEASGGLGLDKPGNVDRSGFEDFVRFVIVEPSIDIGEPGFGSFISCTLETSVSIGEDELVPGYDVAHGVSVGFLWS